MRLGTVPFEHPEPFLLLILLYDFFGKLALIELVLDHKRTDIIALVSMIGSSDATDLVVDLGRSAIWTEEYLAHVEKSQSAFKILWSAQSLRMSSPPSIDCWMAL